MLRFLSQNALWTGYWRFAGNLRQTGGIPEIPRTLAGSPLAQAGVIHGLLRNRRTGDPKTHGVFCNL